MRISEIKNCFDDYKVIVCIKFLWEEDLFRKALEKEKDEVTPDKIYSIIRDVYLQMLNMPQIDGQKKKSRIYKKDIRKISKQLYSDPNYWMIGTEWEQKNLEREKRRQKWIEINERAKTLSFLYQRLCLSRVDKNRDIVFQIAKYDSLYEAVMIRETSDLPIVDLESLYDCLEKVILEALRNGEEKGLPYVMNSISFLAYQDVNYWLTKNGLTIDETIRNNSLGNGEGI